MEQSFSIDSIDFAWFQLCCSSHSYLLIFCLALWLSLYVSGIIICLAPPTLPCFLSRWAAWNHGIPQPLPSPSPRRCIDLLEPPSLWAKRITSCGLSAFNVQFLLYWVAMEIFHGFLESIFWFMSKVRYMVNITLEKKINE